MDSWFMAGCFLLGLTAFLGLLFLIYRSGPAAVTRYEAEELLDLEVIQDVIDLRSKQEFAQGAVWPRSINIPANRVLQELPQQDPDRGRSLLFFGPGAASAARLARQLGYFNVRYVH